MNNIIVKQLSKEFFTGSNRSVKIRAIDNISFNIAEGEKVGLIGSNSSGKTTLLRLIAGIYQPSGGSIQTNNSLIPFIDMVWPRVRLTVKENIYLGASLYGITLKEIKKYFLSIVEFAGLENYVHSPSYVLSAGMHERLIVATTLYISYIKKIKNILIDELFSNSDVDFTKKAIKKLEELNMDNVSLIIASHNFEEMIKDCDRVIWLKQGKINKIGDSQTIIDEYLNSSNSSVVSK